MKKETELTAFTLLKNENKTLAFLIHILLSIIFFKNDPIMFGPAFVFQLLFPICSNERCKRENGTKSA